MVPKQDQDQSALQAEKEYRDVLVTEALASVPKRYQGGFDTLATLNPELAERCDTLRKWARNFHGQTQSGWYISGDLGTGKSGLAYAIFMALLPKGHNVILWFVPDLIATIKDSWHNPESVPSEEAIISDASKCDLLILDDLGSERATEWATDTLCLIIDHRYRHCRSVVITSNLRGKDLLGRMATGNGRRIASRLCEMVNPIHLIGKDLRKEKSIERKEKEQ